MGGVIFFGNFFFLIWFDELKYLFIIWEMGYGVDNLFLKMWNILMFFNKMLSVIDDRIFLIIVIVYYFFFVKVSVMVNGFF